MSQKMECKLFRNGQPTGAIAIEFDDDAIGGIRYGTFSIAGAIGWPPTDQFELQPSGGIRIPIVVTGKEPASGGITLAFCSLLTKWE